MKTFCILLIALTTASIVYAQKKGASFSEKDTLNILNRKNIFLQNRSTEYMNGLGIEKEYDKLSSSFIRMMTLQPESIQAENTIMTAKTQTNFKQVTSQDGLLRRIFLLTSKLITSGYTVEKLEALKTQGLNVVEIVDGKEDVFLSKSLVSDLVIIGTFQTISKDTSFNDNHSLSYKVRVENTLKGDTTLKEIIIRDTPSQGSDDDRIAAQTNARFLLFLNKYDYEFNVYNYSQELNKKNASFGKEEYINSYLKKSFNQRQYCFHVSMLSIPLDKGKYLKLGNGVYLSTEEIPREVEKITMFLKQYAPLLPQSINYKNFNKN